MIGRRGGRRRAEVDIAEVKKKKAKAVRRKEGRPGARTAHISPRSHTIVSIHDPTGDRGVGQHGQDGLQGLAQGDALRGQLAAEACAREVLSQGMKRSRSG